MNTEVKGASISASPPMILQGDVWQVTVFSDKPIAISLCVVTQYLENVICHSEKLGLFSNREQATNKVSDQ